VVPFIGASLFASIVGWVVDSLLESWAPIFVRIMVGLVVSIAAFYWARAKLLELRP
jgi:hypothetical protein